LAILEKALCATNCLVRFLFSYLEVPPDVDDYFTGFLHEKTKYEHAALCHLLQCIIRRAVKKFSEMWYSTEMVGHMTTLT